MDDMMQALYQELILDHNARPQNFGELATATHRADGVNPLCGDRVTVAVHLDGDRIAAVRFVGQGCAISTASASLMTCALSGQSTATAEALFDDFHRLVTGGGTADPAADDGADAERLGKLVALGGVRAFPMRVKCATLAWHTFRAAMARATGACTE